MLDKISLVLFRDNILHLKTFEQVCETILNELLNRQKFLDK